jgi:hypothetical protein
MYCVLSTEDVDDVDDSHATGPVVEVVASCELRVAGRVLRVVSVIKQATTRSPICH